MVGEEEIKEDNAVEPKEKEYILRTNENAK